MDPKDLFAAVADAVGQALDDASRQLPRITGTDAAVQTARDAFDSATQAIADAADIDAWVPVANAWMASLENLAQAAFTAATDALDQLLVRVLFSQFPRTAATLVTVGVITAETDTAGNTSWDIDWPALQDFFLDPETLINEQTWEDLFADLGHPHSGRLPAVLAAMILLAPRTILALHRNQLGVDGLPNPPIYSGDNASAWAQYRDGSSEWLSFTLPFGDPLAVSPNPPGAMHWQADLAPDMSATLAFRSARRAQGLDTVTDFEAWLALGLDADVWKHELGNHWFIQVEPGLGAGFGKDGVADQWHGAFAPLQVNNPLLPSDPSDPITVSVGREVPGGRPDLIFGPPYDTHFAIEDLGAWVKFREATPVFEIGFDIEGMRAVLAPRWWRDFGQPSDLWREGVRFDLSMAFSYGVGVGVTLNLTSGLEIVWNVNWKTGGDGWELKLHSIRLVVELQADEDGIQARAKLLLHVSGQIGPVGIVVDGPGFWLGWWPAPAPDPGWRIADWFGLLPPTGAGLSVEIGPVIGGGFVDWKGGDNDKYAGLLYLKIYAIEVTAFGIHERTEGGRTSFVAVLGARFSPGIALGWGFAITGFGGLVGINRRIDTDALRFRLSVGAVGNVLFAPDPVKNAPIILGDLDALFPAADQVHVGGPTMRISWIELVHFDIGLFFEIAVGAGVYGTTGLTKVLLLGSAHCRLGPEDFRLIDIQLDIVGFYDRVEGVVEFDASLVSSKILYYFVLTGDTAFRLSWGHHTYAMFTLGGFHPAFDPAPAQFPELARLGIAYDYELGFKIWFRKEFYFAITTNSLQMGGLTEVGIRAGPVNAVGWLAYDVLIQFKPFWFTASISAGFRVRFKAITLCGVRVTGTLSGPGPITIAAEFCIEILFFDICWSDSFDIGAAVTQAVETVASLLLALVPELGLARNLAAVGAVDNLATSSAALTAGDMAVVSPVGGLAWSQRVAPMDTLLDRFAGDPLQGGPQAVTVSSPQSSGVVVKDLFSPGSFASLSGAEALNRPAFERLPAGVELGFAGAESALVARNVSVKTFILPKNNPLLVFALTFPTLVTGAAELRRAAPGVFVRKDPQLAMGDEGWTLHDGAGGVVGTGLSATDAHQRARFQGGMAAVDKDAVDLGGI